MMRYVREQMKQIEEQKDTMDFNMSVPSRSPSFKEIKLILWVNAGVTVLAVLGIVFVMAVIF
ncbi:MAG: hypothetical protein QF470_05805 [Methylococcales bacterium]|nr:hypothetical protein [Methylococcales bacterium]